MITTSRNQIEPSVILFFAVVVEPDPWVPYPPPYFSTSIVKTPAHGNRTQPQHTAQHAAQHTTHSTHYTPATAMAVRSEPWRRGSLVAQTPEDIGGRDGLLAYVDIVKASGQHSGTTVKCKTWGRFVVVPGFWP